MYPTQEIVECEKQIVFLQNKLERLQNFSMEKSPAETWISLYDVFTMDSNFMKKLAKEYFPGCKTSYYTDGHVRVCIGSYELILPNSKDNTLCYHNVESYLGIQPTRDYEREIQESEKLATYLRQKKIFSAIKLIWPSKNLIKRFLSWISLPKNVKTTNFWDKYVKTLKEEYALSQENYEEGKLRKESNQKLFVETIYPAIQKFADDVFQIKEY